MREEKELISSIEISQIHEGTGNIINVVEKVIEENEKTPVCSHNSQ